MTKGPIEDSLFGMLADLPAGKSVSPDQVAKALEPEAWRRMLPKVRSTAIGLARQGQLVITRHGKPADPNQFRGVYRLRLPLPEDPQHPHSGGEISPDTTEEETP